MCHFCLLYFCVVVKQENLEFVMFVLTAPEVVMKRDLAAVLLRRRRAAPAGDLTPLQLERYSYLLKKNWLWLSVPIYSCCEQSKINILCFVFRIKKLITEAKWEIKVKSKSLWDARKAIWTFCLFLHPAWERRVRWTMPVTRWLKLQASLLHTPPIMDPSPSKCKTPHFPKRRHINSSGSIWRSRQSWKKLADVTMLLARVLAQVTSSRGPVWKGLLQVFRERHTEHKLVKYVEANATLNYSSCLE